MGFPLDLTQIMAGEAGMTVDADGYAASMAAQKSRAQAAQKFSRGSSALVLEAEQTVWLSRDAGVAVTDDSSKYDWHIAPPTAVAAIYLGKDKDAQKGFLSASARADASEGEIGVVLNSTSFYAESGGQVSDVGELSILPAGSADDAEPVGVVTITDVQVFGGFVLHKGAVTTGTLGVGDRVIPRVNYERRALIGPNHTMTHVLNFALREVLGDGVEQRGSAVEASKLRFDYSTSKTPTPEQLARIEAIVSAQIARALPVYSKVVPLAAAKSVRGLRAVFGETYPDPVRVVSVGASIEDLLANPTAPEWDGISIELCGGTHIANTSRAGAFALLSDEALAKGIRRLTAVTRDTATSAFGRAAELEGEFAVARSLSGDALEVALNKLQTEVDSSSMSAHIKSRLRDAHADLSKRLFVERKAAAAALVEASTVPVLAAAAAAVASGTRFVVLDLPALRADGKVLASVLAAVRKAHPTVSIFAVSSDGSEKLQVCTSAAGDVNATTWINAALGAHGGKGGGTPATAAGSLKNVALIGALLADATAWARENLK